MEWNRPVMFRLAATILGLLLCLPLPALAQQLVAPSVIVIFVHGRYENATGDDWTDDIDALDASVVRFDAETPMGKKTFRGVSDGRFLRKRMRDTYWRGPKSGSLSETVEKRVGRGATYYVRYDARDSWYYEPKAAPLVADEVRAWLLADPGRAASLRNIVWIAHSNGGLIVRALMSDPQYADLINRTREVITLGTPHRGSEMADAGLDTDRVKFISDALVDCDTTIGRAARLFGRFTVFDMVSKLFVPYFHQIEANLKAQAQAEGWKKSDLVRLTRRAKANFVAQVFERELSGRIDQQLTTRFMEATQIPGAEHRLLPAAELPVPFFWVRGSLYPMDFLRMAGGLFQVGTWDDNDLVYFVVAAGVVSPRLAQRFPDHPFFQRSDGVVSVESAAALGLPLGGHVGRASINCHHSDLPFNKAVRKLVDKHLEYLMSHPLPPLAPPERVPPPPQEPQDQMPPDLRQPLETGPQQPEVPQEPQDSPQPPDAPQQPQEAPQQPQEAPQPPDAPPPPQEVPPTEPSPAPSP